MADNVYPEGARRDLLAGFRGHGGADGAQAVLEAYAIITRESGWNTKAVNVNKDGSRDRGLWQWNDKAWPSISDKCAFDPVCSTLKAIEVSKNGKDWGPWKSSGSVHPDTTGVKLPNTANADDAGLFGVGRGTGLDTKVGDALNISAKFYKLLTSTEFWLRLGEAIAGIILITLGLKMLTGVDATNIAVNVAKAAGKVAK